MISVVIPTLNSEATLTRCLAALVPAAVDGIVQQVVIADGNSQDDTCLIADDAGADIVTTEAGRGNQIRAGIAETRSPWLLILHSDTQLEPSWASDAQSFMEAVDFGRKQLSAAAFRFALDDAGIMPRLVEQMVHVRCRLAKLPYGDQGLLIPKRLLDKIGGYEPIPLMEDVDIVRRLGRSRLTVLKSKALTDPARYNRDGYLRRVARNQICMAMYLTGQPIEKIADFYHRPSKKKSLNGTHPSDQKTVGDINPS